MVVVVVVIMRWLYDCNLHLANSNRKATLLPNIMNQANSVQCVRVVLGSFDVFDLVDGFVVHSLAFMRLGCHFSITATGGDRIHMDSKSFAPSFELHLTCE